MPRSCRSLLEDTLNCLWTFKMLRLKLTPPIFWGVQMDEHLESSRGQIGFCSLNFNGVFMCFAEPSLTQRSLDFRRLRIRLWGQGKARCYHLPIHFGGGAAGQSLKKKWFLWINRYCFITMFFFVCFYVVLFMLCFIFKCCSLFDVQAHVLFRFQTWRCIPTPKKHLLQ